MSEQPSVPSLRVEKPGKSKFVPVVAGGGERRKAALPTILPKEHQSAAVDAGAAEGGHREVAAAENILDEYLDITRSRLDASGDLKTTHPEGAKKRPASAIEMVAARRERRRSVSSSLPAPDAARLAVPETPTSAASLVNFTAGRQSRVTMAHFLTDTGAGIPMSATPSASLPTVAKKTMRRVKGSLATAVVPQVRVVAGEIVVDEEAPVAASEEDEASASHTVDVVNESAGRHLTSHAFVKTIGNNRWNAQDTDLFYDALSMCGTDFALISLFFPNRSREQVKGKFKVEERRNPGRVARHLRNRKPLDSARIDDLRRR